MPKSRAMPAAVELWDLFEYNPLTGDVFWRIPKQGRQVDKPVGTNDNGYRKVVLDRKPYLLHRVVWTWITGLDPGKLFVDHVDRNRADNRWWKLRLVDSALNAVNVPGAGYHCRRGGVGPRPWIVTRYTRTGRPACESYATEEEAKARADQIKRDRLSAAVLPNIEV
jgi:hypothetical protein